MPILCATDFSTCSDRAIELGGALAKRWGDKLIVLHVVEPMMAALPYAVEGVGQLEVGMKEAADTVVESTVAQLRAQGIDAQGQVFFGTPRATILEFAQGCKPQLIVAGTHGRKGVARLFLGSVAAALMKSAPCPVVVCGSAPLDLDRWRSDAPLNLLAGVDATRASAAALDWIGALPARISRKVTAVRLFWPAQEAIRYGLESDWSAGHSPSDLLQLLVRDLPTIIPPSLGLAPSDVRFKEAHVNAAQVLVEAARLSSVDAIVVGVPRHGIEVWNAIAPAELLQAAPVPVFCVPEATRPAAIKPHEMRSFRSVLVATDLSDASNQAITAAYSLLPPGGGRVELCHVHERGHQGTPVGDLALGPPLAEDERAKVEARLRALIPEPAERLGIKTHVSVLEGPTAPDAILHAARRLDVDVLALASHGRSGLRRAVMGSVAEEVARRSDRPVLIVHERNTENLRLARVLLEVTA